MGSNQGFSLLEVLIVLGIVGIPSIIAYPAWSRYLVKTKRLEAQLALLDTAQRMEQYAIENSGQYTNATFAKLGLTDKTERGWYKLRITQAEPAQYTLSATPTFHDPTCQQLIFNQLGEKRSEGTGTLTDCWQY